MKVVLDTNVFISGIFWQGAPHQIIELAEKGKIQIYSTPEILTELFGVLQREKFKPLLKEANLSWSQVIEKVSELVKTCVPVKKVEIIKEDPSDNTFFECALSCGASFIISGDPHLLKLKEFKGILIITPREFLKTLLL